MLHSISDLTTFCRKTTGDVPSKLVGASTTVVGSKMYLFGGRLVTERRMVSDLYVFDLETFNWEKIPPSPEDDVPRARYFHSADTWNNQLIIFGGMSNRFDSPNPDDLCVLNDVRFFDLSSRRWLPSSLSNGVLSDPVSDALVPRARYAHLSTVTADRLFIIGGQDFFNEWLDDVCVYDLLGKAWVQRRDYPRHCGTYRSVAVSANMCVRLPQEERQASQTPSTLGPPGTRFRPDNVPPTSTEFTSSESLAHLPYSASPTEEHPSDIYLYSNYNFTDVKRELEVFSPLPDTDFTIEDRSASMTGSSFPPGLRFPTGAILGTHFIIAGTYLAHTYQSFSIWALDLLSMTWTRIDPGSAVATGSWFRGCLWAEANKFLIFGNRDGNLVDDYNRRLLSWDHVAVVDLEAFGIYQPPTLRLDISMQVLGLAALEERVLTDFEIVCDDGRKIPCSRKILEERWPWFKDQRKKFLQTAKQTLKTLPSSSMHIGLPDLPGVASLEEARPDPRLTPRSFQLSEPYPITLALLQYFYSLALPTPLQQAPAVLSQLLVLSTTYQISHLESLVKHAMHRALSNSTSVGVYEVATLCSCRSLQIRALKTVMSYSQKRPSRSRPEKESGGRPPGPSGGGGGGGGNKPAGGGPSDSTFTTRPRGTSDAHWRRPTDQNAGAGKDFSLKHNFSNGDGRSHTTTLSAVAEDSSLPTHKENSTPPTSPSPRPVTQQQQHHDRNASIVSVYTDREICAVAELMSPALIDSRSRFSQAQEESIHAANTYVAATDDNFDSIIEPYYLHQEDDGQFELPSRPDTHLNVIPEISYPSTGPSSRATSTYSDSEFEHSSDEQSPYTPSPNPSYVPFHLPRPRAIYNGARDSNTPSLASSTSFSSLASTSRSQPFYDSPVTPNSLSSPFEYTAGSPHLAIIEERLPEDQEITYRLPEDLPESPSGITVVPRESSKMTSWPKQKSNVEWFPAETTPSLRSPTSPASIISNSDTVAPIPQSPKSMTNHRAGSVISFSRFLGNSKDSSKAQSKAERTSKEHSIKEQSIKSQTDLSDVVSGFDPKMVKAEEKKRKKAEAKARTERLALELKERSKARAANADKDSLNSAKERNREQVAMYGGVAGITM